MIDYGPDDEKWAAARRWMTRSATARWNMSGGTPHMVCNTRSGSTRFWGHGDAEHTAGGTQVNFKCLWRKTRGFGRPLRQTRGFGRPMRCRDTNRSTDFININNIILYITGSERQNAKLRCSHTVDSDKTNLWHTWWRRAQKKCWAQRRKRRANGYKRTTAITKLDTGVAVRRPKRSDTKGGF